jgi:hypothetical protein
MQPDAIGRLALYTKDSQRDFAESDMVQLLSNTALTERSYYQALAVWEQCWRTLELLEQLYRPQTSSVRNIPAERCKSAQLDLQSLNKHFGYTPLASDQELSIGAAFPFWSKSSVEWYGLVYAMRVLTLQIKPIGEHLRAHFSQSVSLEHLSFFDSDKATAKPSGADVKSWNQWLETCLTTEAEIQASGITATEILDWFNRCLQGFERPRARRTQSKGRNAG